MKGASGTPDPPCVSEYPIVPECPNVRMSEYPIRMRKQSDAKTDPSAASIDAPRADGDSRRRSTPWTPQTTTDADKTRRAEHLCDANVFRRRDDANPDARRRGRARARANADWTPRRRGARRSERAMGLETALLRNHERLGKIALTGGFAFGFAYTTKTGTSPLAGWGWTPRTREASARAATAND